jgi:hypothetical protein
MDRSSWPHIYRVTLRSIDGDEHVKGALSWLGELKAVAMVVEYHHSRSHRGKPSPVYSVHVEDTGPAPKSAAGMVDWPRDVLDDRMEF